jgi:GT2 family glycosyltransferase
MGLTVVVLNWNGWQDTRHCLDALLDSEGAAFDIVLIENGSKDDSWSQMQQWLSASAVAAKPGNSASAVLLPDETEQLAANLPRKGSRGEVLVRAFRWRTNLGFCKACNIGISVALGCDSDRVLLLNNDAVVATNTLSQLQAALTGSVGIVGATITDLQGRATLFSGAKWPHMLFGIRSGSRSSKDSTADTAYADGAAMLIDADLLRKRNAESGYFLDPKYFVYCEEADLCRFAISRGWRCVVGFEPVVRHGHSASLGGAGNPISYYYLTRNRVWLANRWLEPGWLFLFHCYYVPSRLGILVVRLLRGQWKHAAAIIEGLVHGYLGIGGPWRFHLP